MNYLPHVKINFIFLLIFALGLHGCSMFKVAEYDAKFKEDIIQVAKKVDLFWGQLQAVDDSERQYDKFKDQYALLESEIRSLIMKSDIRPLNSESTQQAKIALELLLQDQKIHQSKNSMSDFQIKRHRKQYTRIFTAMAKGEEAKNISPSSESTQADGERQ